MLLESTGSESDVNGADTDWLLELGFDFSSDLFDSNEAAADEPAKGKPNEFSLISLVIFNANALHIV